MKVTNKLAGVGAPASAAVSQVLLGAGGRSPGVGLFDLRTGATENVLQLPEGDSAYRMGRTTDGQSVVVGTKGGRLYWTDLMFNEESPKGHAPIKRAQGAPVLGILVTDAGQTLVCDSRVACCCGIRSVNTLCRWFLTGTLCVLSRDSESSSSPGSV